MTGRDPVRNASRGMAGAVALTLALALPVRAQAPSVDELVRLAVKPPGVYTMTADFDGRLAIRYGDGALLTAVVQGGLNEWHATGEPLRRKITIREVQLPFLLRPFAGFIRRVIKERIETQPTDLPDFHAHDFFLVRIAPEGRYVIGGLRRDIVTQALARYQPSWSAREDGTDTRRAIAKWLFASPLMRPWVVRPGPPYALEGVVEEQGLLDALTIYYDWGTVGAQVVYAFLCGQPVWNRVQVDAAGHLPTLGSISGRVTISLSNQCLDCAGAGSDQGSRPCRSPTGKQPLHDQLALAPAGDEGRCRARRRTRRNGDPARLQPVRFGGPPRRGKIGDPRRTRLPRNPGGNPRRYGPPPAVAVALSPEERTALERLCRAGKTERRLADRAQAVLLAAAGWGNALIATYLHRSRYWVQRWRRRFGARRLAGLSDRPRSGRRPRLFPFDR